MGNLSLKPFHFIRHGQTAWNLESRCMGQQDIPLNETGVMQAMNAVKLLRNANVQTICYSSLSRAQKTAEIINEQLNCKMVKMDGLKECCWGEMIEGQLKADVPYLHRWRIGETFPGGESYAEFSLRVIEAFREILSYPFPLIVSHGGVYWPIQDFLGVEYEQQIDIENCIPFYHVPPKQIQAKWNIFSLDVQYDMEPLG